MFPILRQALATVNILGKTYVIVVSNLIASIVFLITGLLVLGLAMTGKLSAENMDVFTRTITNALNNVNASFGNNLALNILFTGILIGFFIGYQRRYNTCRTGGDQYDG